MIRIDGVYCGRVTLHLPRLLYTNLQDDWFLPVACVSIVMITVTL